MIYFMQPSAGGNIKIGFSLNVERRHKELKAIHGHDLLILATMEGDESAERALHRRFSALRCRRSEFFAPAEELLAFIGAVNEGNPQIGKTPAPIAKERFVVYLPPEVGQALRDMKAQERGMSFSEFAEDAIREMLVSA